MEKIKVNVDWCGNYCASSEMVPGCVAACKGSLDVFKKYWEESVQFHFEGFAEDEIPEWYKGEYEFDYELSVSATIKVKAVMEMI